MSWIYKVLTCCLTFLFPHYVFLQLQLIVTKLDEIRKEVLLLRANIKQAEKELHTTKKDIESLQKQLTVTGHRKDEAYKCILQLGKLLE